MSYFLKLFFLIGHIFAEISKTDIIQGQERKEWQSMIVFFLVGYSLTLILLL